MGGSAANAWPHPAHRKSSSSEDIILHIQVRLNDQIIFAEHKGTNKWAPYGNCYEFTIIHVAKSDPRNLVITASFYGHIGGLSCSEAQEWNN